MRAVIFACVLAVAVSACGKSEEQKAAEKAAEDLKQAAEALGKAAAQTGTAAATAGAGEAAKAMQSMANALNAAGGDGKPVEPVSFQTLQAQLPKVSGWEMKEPEGERMTMPVPFSQIETRYTKDSARIDVKIVDTGFAQLLVAPWSMMLASGYSRETSRGYEKSTTIGGNPAIEKWNKDRKNGELDVLLGKRFMVTIEGREISDISELHAFASNFDFGAIAALK
ncbi:MAG TPA: hypothetical protein VNT81_15820 [Vicinamibacterales bacterium]|nr:hypothetical protein [Vicinamibacterales bacterium]